MVISYPIPVRIRFKSLHQEIHFGDAAWQRSFEVNVHTRDFVLVGSNDRFANRAHGY